MILQIGAFFGGLLESVVTPIIKTVSPTLLNVGQQFLERELTRKTRRRQKNQLKAQAVAALNTPGISVSRIGGTIQPVGGRVQRSTFTPAATTPAQNPFGNIPLLPVAAGMTPRFRGPAAPIPGPMAGFGTFIVPPLNGGTMPKRAPGAPGEPRFAIDEFGNTIKFVPSPRPGEGFIGVNQARQLNLNPTRPFWRFNRLEGQFEKMKARRLNPFNFKAAQRAGRRVERTLDAIKQLVSIQRKIDKGVSAGGKLIKFRTGKRKKA